MGTGGKRVCFPLFMNGGCVKFVNSNFNSLLVYDFLNCFLKIKSRNQESLLPKTKISYFVLFVLFYHFILILLHLFSILLFFA